MENYVVCAHRSWNIGVFKETMSTENYHLIDKKEDLTMDKLNDIKPKILFSLDWSWVIPKEITDKFTCIQFHSAPLPYFRGGSPIQNQIIRGIKNTKITAFVMDDGIDTGDIVDQKNLSLEGNIIEIFNRSAKIIFEMIDDIVNSGFVCHKQIAGGSYYRRRKPEESNIDFNKSIEYLYDFIRMLGDPYPNAFLNIDDKKISFKSAKLEGDKIFATIEIERTDDE